MSNTITEKITTEECKILRSDSTSKKEKCIKDILVRLEDRHLSGLLSDFCNKTRETYNEDPIVNDISFDSDNTGMVEVSFSGSVYMGCKNYNDSNDYYETIKFWIDSDSLQITFETEPPQARDYDEDEI